MPKLSDADLIKAIEDKEIGALTLDTTAFDQYGCNLDFVVLQRVDQFRKHFPIVFTEINAGEVVAHIQKELAAKAAALSPAINQYAKVWKIDAVALSDVHKSLAMGTDPLATAKARWDHYVKALNAHILTGQDYASFSDVIGSYFDIKAPFESNDDKKHEFPDAIALSILEGWCKKNTGLMLAVSADGGWQRYAAQSENIVVVPDLKTFFNLYNQSAHAVAQTVIGLLRAGSALDLAYAIENAVQSRVDDLDFDHHVGASLEVEAVPLSASVKSLGYPDEPFVIFYDDDTVTFSLGIHATITVDAEFNFSVHDSIDDDYVSLGSSTSETDHTISLDVVVEISRKFEDEPDVLRCEVRKSRIYVDFGYVHPNWEREDED